MPGTYAYPRYSYVPPDDDGARHPVVVAGGGLAGLTVALDLALRGQRVVLLDDDDTVSLGPRAISFAKRTLEIYARLGLGPLLLGKGVTWTVSRVFFGDRLITEFDQMEEPGHQYPAFINLQQYYLERWLVEACQATGLVDLRWRNRVVAVGNRPGEVALTIEVPDGCYRLTADWLLACDGANSFVRESLDLPFVGRVFHDRFLIVDVVMQAGFPAERRFWFDPPFHRGGSVLLHCQADNVWRIDFQLGWDCDPEAEKDPDRVCARVRAMLGPDIPFELEQVSLYTFHCRRLEKFRHGRTLFLGDAAHQVSPFGARGGNAGVQDADNLAWKLLAVLRGDAPEALLDSYDEERAAAADENILASTRSADFITPRNEAARAYRDAVLDLAARHAFARPLVNSGRLSRPAVLRASRLNTPDAGGAWAGGLPPGAPAADAPVLCDGREDWLLRHLAADGFSLLLFGAPDEVPAAALTAPAGRARQGAWPVRSVFVSPAEADGVLWDRDGLAAARYDAQPGTAVLLRPDQHVAARWRGFDQVAVAAARRRALGIVGEERERIPA
jgi:3-(3-hydroxy-phenyl)propionate hydroxylase